MVHVKLSRTQHRRRVQTRRGQRSCYCGGYAAWHDHVAALEAVIYTLRTKLRSQGVCVPEIDRELQSLIG